VRRRIVIISVVAPLVALIVGAVAIWLLVFGGRPTIQRAGSGTPGALASCPPPSQSPTGISTFHIDTAKSSASYEAHFQAEGQPLPGTVTGATGDVTGDIQLGTQPSPTIAALRVMVDLRTLNSGAAERDGHVQTDTFETDKYPFATFVTSNAQVLSGSYSPGQQITFPLTGDLTLHGVTRPASFAVTGQLTNNTLTGSASASIHLQDFAMKPPETTAIVKITVSDEILLKIDFMATTAMCATSSKHGESMSPSSARVASEKKSASVSTFASG
jgi:polyisoprenoid-binding protein YceI